VPFTFLFSLTSLSPFNSDSWWLGCIVEDINLTAPSPVIPILTIPLKGIGKETPSHSDNTSEKALGDRKRMTS
jgi:hypothetical protein